MSHPEFSAGSHVPLSVALAACEAAVEYSLVNRSDYLKWRAGSWQLFIDALMEAPEVTDDG